MKRTVIKYRKQNGRFIIQAIENAATPEELVQVFGKKVAKAYLTNFPRYWRALGAEKVFIKFGNGMGYSVKSGIPYTQETFEKIIVGMKQGGEALGRIVATDRESQVREIVI